MKEKEEKAVLFCDKIVLENFNIVSFVSSWHYLKFTLRAEIHLLTTLFHFYRYYIYIWMYLSVCVCVRVYVLWIYVYKFCDVYVCVYVCSSKTLKIQLTSPVILRWWMLSQRFKNHIFLLKDSPMLDKLWQDVLSLAT